MYTSMYTTMYTIIVVYCRTLWIRRAPCTFVELVHSSSAVPSPVGIHCILFFFFFNERFFFMSADNSDSDIVVSAQPHHVHLCFFTLASHLRGRPHPEISETHFDGLLADENFPACPLFVTFNTRINPSRKDLRGCIGTFHAQPLARGLKSYALTAALYVRW